tara:strand:- start:701 stop:1051 length:351 start_codon:yes stop_codon:yes gene_type:complete
MFVTVELESNIPVGTCISYDATSKKYLTATSAVYPLGVIISESHQDTQTQIWTARACFAGVCHALANTDIADQGGPINVVNGKVEVGTDSAAGVISPRSYGNPARNVGDLVMIHLR